MSDERLTGWIVTVEGTPGAPLSADLLELFAEALDRQPEAHGAAASGNTETGGLSATMTFDAASEQAAARSAFNAYLTARLASRLPPATDERFHIDVASAERDAIDETPKRYVARVDVAPEPAAA